MACLRLGAGPPLVFLPGLSSHHRPPWGMDRWLQLQQIRPFADGRQVWWIQRRDDPDMLATIEAEDAFDLAGKLSSITAPVLVIGGDHDAFYGTGVFQETAALLPRGRLVLYPGKGHAGTVTSRQLPQDVLTFLRAAPGSPARP